MPFKDGNVLSWATDVPDVESIIYDTWGVVISLEDDRHI